MNENKNRYRYNWSLIIIISILLILALGSYWCQFYNYPISKDPTDWANFGGYLGGTTSFITVLVALCINYQTIKLTKKNSIREY
ncbi:hypothetical protein K5X82_10030 [Halosquirtibacter xylanolyticus]|uniref:hypothetical protein n=1 Tax=Halosquirtibacter xylanolyticus TaxID=3374599 RepID=UPI00374983CA|nr:hypothetical protein K5X82_10030 [Prolixibacteraceae bacterium]